MAESAPDGLASLSAQRTRARRSMPPPRHPVPADAERQSAEVGQAVAEPEQGRESVPAAAPLSAVPTSTAPDSGTAEGSERTTAEPAVPASKAAGVSGAPVKVTLYVDRSSDEFMEAARIEGLVARPKVDISRSAVVRLALRRLMSEMSAAEIKTVLEQQEVRDSGPGRKRR